MAFASEDPWRTDKPCRHAHADKLQCNKNRSDEYVCVQATRPAQGDAQVAELLNHETHRQQGQTSACWTLYCRHSGITMQINTWAMLSSNLTVVKRSGGNVTSVQMATRTDGLLLWANRSNGRGCPQCAGRGVCKHNSLRTKAPLVAAELHPTKNAFSPEDITANNRKSAVWRCQACSHVWTARVNHRVGQGTGCPECSRPVTVRKRHPTLADSNHFLLGEWDPVRNAALGNLSDKTTAGSKKKVFWLCPNCPAGQEHSYLTRVDCRTRKHATGCPFCCGQKACKCNSLCTHYPQLALEWDYVKNEGTAHSHYMAWWTSGSRGSWQQSIDVRTRLLDYECQRRLIKQHGL